MAKKYCPEISEVLSNMEYETFDDELKIQNLIKVKKPPNNITQEEYEDIIESEDFFETMEMEGMKYRNISSPKKREECTAYRFRDNRTIFRTT